VSRRDRLDVTARLLIELVRVFWLVALAAGGGAATLRLGVDHPWRELLMWGAIVITVLMVGAGLSAVALVLRIARDLDRLDDHR
jgi:hypothetical protein